MSRRIQILALSIAFAFIGAFAVFSQASEGFTPYVASIKTTIFEVADDGQERLSWAGTHTQAGDRHGNIYHGPSGEANRLWSLFEANSGRSYRIDPDRKKAVIAEEGYRSILNERKSAATASALAAHTKSVNGLSCLEGEVRSRDKGGKLAVTGKTCSSLEFDRLSIYHETRPFVNGKQLHFISEVVSLERNATPNPEWFRVPSGFAIERRNPAP